MSLSLDEGVNKCLLRDVRVDELFELVPTKGLSRPTLKHGPYPLIMSISNSNGYGDYVDQYTHDGVFISVPSTGSVGYCFVQKGKFCMLESSAHPPSLLKLKDEYKYLEECLSALAFTMTVYFTRKYNYSTKLNNSRLMNEVIPNIPFVQAANGEWIIDVSGLKYMYL